MMRIDVILMVALLAAFLLLLARKVGFVEWMQVHGDRLLSQLFSCDFCLSFWAAMPVCACLACYCDEPLYMLVPVFSTPITRFLL